MRTLQPYQTSLADVHLNWMQDYQPALLMQKFHDGSLKDYLNAIVDKAETIIESMESNGFQEISAKEIVNETILAPFQPVDAENSLSEKEMKKIREYLDI